MAIAEPNDDGSACAVALIVTLAGLGTVAGAVYKPAEVIVPQAFPEQPDPLTLQVTAVFVVPVTVAWNCCWLPIVTIVVDGAMATLMGLMMVTAAVADVTPSAMEVAFTVTAGGDGTASGAVYKPAEVMVPHAEPTQPVPLTLQVTPVTSVLITLAVNC